MAKRVIIITGVFYPEPVVSAGLMRDLATDLSKNYQVTVIRPRPSRPMGFEIPEYSYDQFPFEVIETDSYVHPASSLFGRGRESYSMGKWCEKYIEQHYEEICFIYNGPWHMFGRSMVEKSCLKYNIPYITPVQDVYPESLSSKFPNFPFLKKIVYGLLFPSDKSLLSHAAKIHTISDKMVDYLSKTRNLPKDKFFVVRNWQDESAFVDFSRNKIGQTEKGLFTFMYLGNVGPLAGIDVLFEALRKAGLKDVRLVVAGSGSAKQHLMEKAKEYNDCNIDFWEVPAGEVPATQDKADVMVLPVKKGFAMSSIPSKLPAYMFSAKPVLASVDTESDTALCIRECDAGWVAIPEDVESIANAMKAIYSSSKEELQAKGKRGFDYAIENFSKQKNLRKLTDACINVINSHHANL